jgi:hypothetical protein
MYVIIPQFLSLSAVRTLHHGAAPRAEEDLFCNRLAQSLLASRSDADPYV